MIIRQILDGFKELIKGGFVHRDIKPENCLIHNNIYKMADFGFATYANKGQMKEQVGTALYMSPQLL